MAKPQNRPAGPDAAATDEALVTGCLEGDERAWATLIMRYAGYIHAVASRAFGLGPSAADEVFQDVCVRVYEGLPGFAGRGEFRSWVRAVVLSAAREHLRREARRPDASAVDDHATDAAIAELEQALDVRSAVTALGEPCSGTIRLYFFRNLTQAEVASALGVPPGTVAARLSRCLKRLREALQEPDPPRASRG